MRNFIANWKNMTVRNKVIMVVMFGAILGLGAVTLFGVPAIPSTNGQETGAPAATNNPAPEPAPNVELSESQKKAIDGYGDEEEEIIARLQNGLWSTLDERTVVTFSERTFTTSASGSVSEPRPYAILSHAELTPDPYETEYTVNTVVAVETDEGVSILNLQRTLHGSTSSFALDWPAVADGTLQQVGLARTVKVNGDVSKLSSLVGQDAVDGIVSEVQGQAIEYYPTATIATWSGLADVDWNDRRVRTSFTLNNAAETVIDVERKIPDGNGKD